MGQCRRLAAHGACAEDSQGAYQVKSHSAGRGGSGVCEPQFWNPEEALTL